MRHIVLSSTTKPIHLCWSPVISVPHHRTHGWAAETLALLLVVLAHPVCLQSAVSVQFQSVSKCFAQNKTNLYLNVEHFKWEHSKLGLFVVLDQL